MTKRKRSRDPIADYIEWTNHRYDPGYYLGGNPPPHLRKESLGSRGKQKAGLLLGTAAVASLVAAVGSFRVGSRWELLISVGVVCLMGLAAVKMYRAGARKAPPGRPR